MLDALVNVLSVVYAHAYFPCHSNGLKDVAGCLGFSWSDPKASGVQSIVWRKRWEAGHAEEWKQWLVTYNQEDCAALRKVVEFLSAVGSEPGQHPRRMKPGRGPGGPAVAWVEELGPPGGRESAGQDRVLPPGLPGAHQRVCPIRLPAVTGLYPNEQSF